MQFYLGTDRVHWLSEAGVPLFVSHRVLSKRRSLPRATESWALDSGGFTELALHGRFVTSPRSYVAAVARYCDEVGVPDFAAPQDWMCEPAMLARTGLTVVEHQRRTVANFIELKTLAAEQPFMPVLQGWTLDDYRRCVDMYERAGIDLAAEPRVGLGSVCRRQRTREIETISWALAADGLRIHGFGVKTGGLSTYGAALVSADSMSWSLRARRADPLPGCPHVRCSHCLDFALRWRSSLVRRLDNVQLRLAPFAAAPLKDGSPRLA